MNHFKTVSPESVGISSHVLLRMMKKLSDLEYLNSIIVLRHGCSVLECWIDPYRRETPHQLFSLSKSFTSCAIGLTQAEGRLKITDKLISFFPGYDSHETPLWRSLENVNENLPEDLIVDELTAASDATDLKTKSVGDCWLRSRTALRCRVCGSPMA